MAADTPVSLLNIICTQGDVVPVYNLIAKEGRVHAPVFTYTVTVLDITEEGSGQSKKKAKHIAARNMLKRIRDETDLVEGSQFAAIERVLAKCDEEDIAEAIALQKQTKMITAGGESPEKKKSGGDVMVFKENANEVALDETNPVGKLQEISMKKSWQPPVYEDIGEKGAAHDRLFVVECIIENMQLHVRGEGKSKKLAKRAAAQEMINKLRNENLDKVDELLDKLPRNKNWIKPGHFDFTKEITKMQQNCDESVPREDKLIANFFSDLKNNEEKMLELSEIFGKNMKRFVIDYMIEDNVMPEVEKLVKRIEETLNIVTDVYTYTEKTEITEKFQCLGSFIAKDPKYHSATILASYGTDTDLKMAKLKTLSRCVLVLLSFLV